MDIVDISTFTTVAGVVAATTFTRKTLGTSGRWNTLLAVVWGMILSTADFYANGGQFTGQLTVTTLFSGFILGLTASGLYDLADKTGTRLEPADAGRIDDPLPPLPPVLTTDSVVVKAGKHEL